VTLILVLLVIGILAVIGGTEDDEVGRLADPPSSAPPTSAEVSTSPPSSTGTAPAPKKPKPKRATLRVQPTGDVEVCLRAKGQGVLIDGVILKAGDDSRTFRASRFAIRVGNNAVRLRWNGKAFRPPPSSTPIGYVFTRTGRRRLSADQLPTCGR